MGKKGIRTKTFRALRLLGVSMVLCGFALPWIDYRAPAIIGELSGLPDGQMVAGWRLPFFAREVEGSWTILFSRMFADSDTDPALAWLVWISPLIAVLCLLAKGPAWSRLFGWLHLLPATALLWRAATGFPEVDLLGFEALPAAGLWLSGAAHLFCAGLLASRV